MIDLPNEQRAHAVARRCSVGDEPWLAVTTFDYARCRDRYGAVCLSEFEPRPQVFVLAEYRDGMNWEGNDDS